MATALTAKNKTLQAHGGNEIRLEGLFYVRLRGAATSNRNHLCELHFDLLGPISTETLQGATHTQDPVNLKRLFYAVTPSKLTLFFSWPFPMLLERHCELTDTSSLPYLMSKLKRKHSAVFQTAWKHCVEVRD